MDSLNSISNNGINNKSSSNSAPTKPSNEGLNSGSVKESLPDVHIDLSSELSSVKSEEIMREAKIMEMRAAIEEGRFPLDAKKIAENFAELEKLL